MLTCITKNDNRTSFFFGYLSYHGFGVNITLFESNLRSLV